MEKTGVAQCMRCSTSKGARAARCAATCSCCARCAKARSHCDDRKSVASIEDNHLESSESQSVAASPVLLAAERCTTTCRLTQQQICRNSSATCKSGPIRHPPSGLNAVTYSPWDWHTHRNSTISTPSSLAPSSPFWLCTQLQQRPRQVRLCSCTTLRGVTVCCMACVAWQRMVAAAC